MPQNQPDTNNNQPDKLFYNIMPRSEKNTEIVQPSVTVAASETVEEQAANRRETWGYVKQHKLYFIMGLVAIILVPLIIFYLPKLIKPGGQEEPIIVNDPSQIKNSQEQNSGAPAESQQITAEWLQKYFNIQACDNPNICGNEADPDRDGLNNLDEFKIGSDPNNADSDQDGLADGDEVHVFSTNPLKSHTAENSQYSDSDFIKGGYDIATDNKLTEAQIKDLNKKMTDSGLHMPTPKTIEQALINIYNYSFPQDDSSASPNTGSSSTLETIMKNLDQSVEAKQDRDAQRLNTIKNIGVALIRYFDDYKKFPKNVSFADMYFAIKPYLKVATNPQDPINSDPYVYAYIPDAEGQDFTLAYKSETANQQIKRRSSDARKDISAQSAENNDNQRKTDLDRIRTALLLYSGNNAAGNQDYVFPALDKYKTAIVPEFISELPKDPKTGQDYEYKVSDTFDTFTLKAVLENPQSGYTGYLCNQEECRPY